MYTFDTYGCGHVGCLDGKLEKLWNIENGRKRYNGNYVEFPNADFMTKLERKIGKDISQW